MQGQNARVSALCAGVGDGGVVFGICRISGRPACLWIRDGSVMVAA